MLLDDHLAQVFSKNELSSIDVDTLDYIKSILDDKESSDGDLVDSLVPLFAGTLAISEGELTKKVQVLIQKVHGKTGPISDGKPEEAKVLQAPIVMAKVIQEQDRDLKKVWRTEFGAVKVNFNEAMEVADVEGVDMSLDDKEIRKLAKNSKKSIKKEKQDQIREKRFALEREEILAKLSNKPVKIHARGDADLGRLKDIKLEGVSMALGSLELLNDVYVVFSDGRKYGLIGRNGIGKSTFLKHIAGHAFPGIPKNLQILHIEQEVEGSGVAVLDAILATDIEREALKKEAKILQQMLEAESTKDNAADTSLVPKTEEEDEFGLLYLDFAERSARLSEIYNRWEEIEGDKAVSRASTILAGLGFTPEMQQKPTSAYSGGFRMRVALAQALFIDPDILLLDEPTNHLDLLSVLWLEEYLLNYSKTLIIVSHDRDFLNTVCTDIVHMQNKKLVRYKGNYDTFEKLYWENLKVHQRQQENQEKEIKNLEEFITKNRASAATAKMAQSRVKRLEKIKILPEIANDPSFRFNFPTPDELTGPIVQFIDVSFGYSPDKLLYKNLNFTVNMDTRVALIGQNGIGKSTLLKLMFGELEPTIGMVKINPKARMARFTQHHVDQLDMQKSPLQWFQERYPKAKPQDIRKHLGQMGVQGNLALQPIFSLSGGQKSRVALANITYNNPQVMLLDEPSNHLDLDTIEALIRALNNYSGGLIIVSHDEHLITSVCDELWVCENNGITFFKGDFEDYKKKMVKTKSTQEGTITL